MGCAGGRSIAKVRRTVGGFGAWVNVLSSRHEARARRGERKRDEAGIWGRGGAVGEARRDAVLRDFVPGTGTWRTTGA